MGYGWCIQKNGFLSALRLIPHPMITVAQPFQPEMHLCTERLNSCACEWMRQGSHHLGDKPLEKREWENTHHIPSKLHTLHTIQTQSLEKPSQMSIAPRFFDFFLAVFFTSPVALLGTCGLDFAFVIGCLFGVLSPLSSSQSPRKTWDFCWGKQIRLESRADN